ncbi:tRNA-specific adenosine deaminase [Enhygromyxa salina]|uniref:tRNA-specific adenosine deaminase n=2 Tax=Enhygromyxa salina TaxID=215803 RepID=A0A2S9XG90_9BACT|nr:tRNA adenosine(34) deaminase TadA [Enhygromyxa salina]PRP91701.1 tRNA-specific adenosine deaminase [Enhygromyxa salina]
MAIEPTAADLAYMRLAIELAAEAGQRGDVPVGALVVRDGRILGTGFNKREQDHDPSGHAEVVAMREACRQARRWRLDGASLYVTLEPCPMCAGTLVNTRIARLVYGAHDPKAGAVRSLYQLCEDPRLNHQLEVVGGVLAEDCATLLKNFFRAARARARRERAAGIEVPRWARSGDEP